MRGCKVEVLLSDVADLWAYKFMICIIFESVQ